MACARHEVGKAEKYHMLGTLDFNEASAEVLDNNNISDITHLIKTRKPTYDSLVNAHKGDFNITDVEQIEAFKVCMIAYMIAHNGGSLTDWEKELTNLSFIRRSCMEQCTTGTI